MSDESEYSHRRKVATLGVALACLLAMSVVASGVMPGAAPAQQEAQDPTIEIADASVAVGESASRRASRRR